MPDPNPVFTPVFIGLSTGRQDKLQEDLAICPTTER